MPILHAIVLGLVQGLSEFLPISSSGHLLLVPWLFDWNDLDDVSVKKAFDVALHIGTLVAVVGYYRRDVALYVRDGIRSIVHRDRPSTEHGRMAWLLVVASIPAAAVGVVLETWIDEQLGKPWIIAVSLIGFGLVLAWADRRRGEKNVDQIGLRDAAVIGAAQVLALNPGTSRSGITISAMRALGYGRAAAVRMSFVIGVPIIAGAGVFKVGSLVVDGVPDGMLSSMLIGVSAAAVTGWLAISTLTRLAARSNFDVFVWYRVVLGFVILNLALTGLR